MCPRNIVNFVAILASIAAIFANEPSVNLNLIKSIVWTSLKRRISLLYIFISNLEEISFPPLVKQFSFFDLIE